MTTHSRFCRLRAVGYLAAALLSLSAHAAPITWNGGGRGAWENPTQWMPRQVPDASATAVIRGTEAATVAVSANHFIDTLVLDNPNATLWAVGSKFASTVQRTVANGFENGGAIEPADEGSGDGTILTVTSGTLTNGVGGNEWIP